MNNSNFFYILITLLLSSCASYNPNTFSSKSPFSGGIYKIGDPYSIEEKVFFGKLNRSHIVDLDLSRGIYLLKVNNFSRRIVIK